MEQTTKTTTRDRYCLYARKSTERDELQALSIESQVKEMLALAERDKVKVADIRRESHSAKNSGERPVFNQLIYDLRLGLFNGILTWAPDRLSRNAGDLGILVDLMDQGRLAEIKTHGQTFRNSPNEKFLLMILGSQAKLENDHRGENVKRGLRAKCEMGWRPGVTPLGYINEKNALKGEKKVYLDPVRAPVVREMFERVAHDGWSGRRLLNWFNNETAFTTRSGKKVVLSTIYNMLRNPYYCGKFEFPIGGGNWYKVSHESIISEELFNEVQIQLTVAPKSKPGTKEFDFTRLLKCGNCGSGVTAEEKFKRFKNGTIRRYVYYHCTRLRDQKCEERYIREEDLLEQLMYLMDKVSLDKIGAKEKMKKEVERFQKFTQGILGQEATKKLPKVDARNYAKYVLREGTREEKRELLSCLKTELYLKNQVIHLEADLKNPS